MLSEGKAEIGKFKKTIEQGVNDVRAIYGEITGIWAWLKSLFGVKAPAKTVQVSPEITKPVAKKKAQPKQELSYEEYQTHAIHEVCEQLKTFFEIRRQLIQHCNELEDISRTTDKIEDSALDRVEIEMQLENMTVQIREAMVYAPVELRDIYSRFLKMYDQILEEQEFARQVRKKKERDSKWRQELLRNHRIDRAVVAATVLLLALWMWALLLSLGWLVRTPDGLSSLL